jgi:hypothetical protein
MALVLGLTVLVVLSMLGALVAVYTSSGQRSASRSSAGVTAYGLAEAGINNAVSILANPSNNALNPCLLHPPTNPAGQTCDNGAFTKSYDGGSATWWGSLDASASTWSLTSVGSIRNPTDGTRAVTRQITASVRVRPSNMQPANNPLWNYIIATNTGTAGGCDESLRNSVNIQSPMYVLGNMCMNTPSSVTGGPLVVKGSLSLDVNTNVGSGGSPLNEVHVKNGCSYKGGAFTSPCGPSQKVWATVSDATPPVLTIPTPDYASWYVNSAPGPTQGCSQQSGTPPVFDNDTSFNNSVAGIFNLTPPASDYSCVVTAGGGKVIGQLSWDHTAKLLTINGTVFIDGSVTANYGYQNVPVRYTGQGTIYVGGSLLIKTTSLCAVINATNDGCDFASWDPNSNFLVFVVNGTGGQVTAGESMQLVSADFEGGLIGTSTLELDTHSESEGPMLAGSVILDNTVNAHTWPFISAPVGMPGINVVYAQPDPPTNFSG